MQGSESNTEGKKEKNTKEDRNIVKEERKSKNNK
jgi:hypothetical protein